MSGTADVVDFEMQTLGTGGAGFIGSNHTARGRLPRICSRFAAIFRIKPVRLHDRSMKCLKKCLTYSSEALAPEFLQEKGVQCESL